MEDEVQKLRSENADLRISLAMKEREISDYRRILAKIAQYANNLKEEITRADKQAREL